MIARALAGAALLTACSAPATSAGPNGDPPPSSPAPPRTFAFDAAPAAETTMDDTGWSEPESGLRVKLELPAELLAGGEVTALLHFRNDTDEPIRIYLVTADAFRGHQSVFSIARADTGEVVSFQPEPRPHGIVIGEQDFPLLPAGQTTTFEQSLSLHGEAFAGGGTFAVTWTYSNAINAWEGGRETLDGPTVELFGGERIPYIWLGRVSAGTEITVAPATP